MFAVLWVFFCSYGQKLRPIVMKFRFHRYTDIVLTWAFGISRLCLSLCLTITATCLYKLSWNSESTYFLQRWSDVCVSICTSIHFKMAVVVVLWILLAVTGVERGLSFIQQLFVTQHYNAMIFITMYLLLLIGYYALELQNIFGQKINIAIVLWLEIASAIDSMFIFKNTLLSQGISNIYSLLCKKRSLT